MVGQRHGVEDMGSCVEIRRILNHKHFISQSDFLLEVQNLMRWHGGAGVALCPANGKLTVICRVNRNDHVSHHRIELHEFHCLGAVLGLHGHFNLLITRSQSIRASFDGRQDIVTPLDGCPILAGCPNGECVGKLRTYDIVFADALQRLAIAWRIDIKTDTGRIQARRLIVFMAFPRGVSIRRLGHREPVGFCRPVKLDVVLFAVRGCRRLKVGIAYILILLRSQDVAGQDKSPAIGSRRRIPNGIGNGKRVSMVRRFDFPVIGKRGIRLL